MTNRGWVIRFAVAALVAMAALSPGRSVRAGTADTIGIAPEDIALGGSVAARAGSFAAAYFNPAGLSPGGSIPEDPVGFGELTLGFVYASPVVYAERLDGRPVPLAAEPAGTAGFVLGSRFDVGCMLGLDGLNMGLGLFVPTHGVSHWSIHPDEDPQWLFLTDRTQRIGIHLGLAWRIVRWISLGVSLRVLFDVETYTTGRVVQVHTGTDPRTGEAIFNAQTQLGEEVAVYGRAAPNVGLLVTPIDEIRIGLAYRGKLYVDDWGWTRIQGVPVTEDLGYMHRFAHYFHPHQAVVALSGDVAEGLSLSGDLTYSHWEEGLTTNHQALGPGRFGNTITPAVGVEWKPVERLRVFGGYRYVPSPFDNFGGPTNLMDNDQHVLSTGLELRLGGFEGDAPVNFVGSAAFRMAWLETREEHKDPRRFVSDRHFLDNAGAEPYRYGGTVPGMSAGVEVQW